MRIYVIGATGVVGRSLVPQLLAAGHDVTAASRSMVPERPRPGDARRVSVDAFDPVGLAESMVAASPDVVIDQLTDLSGMDPGRMEAFIERNARLRREGTANVVFAAGAAGVGRLVVQSIAWAYAAGGTPHGEADPLDISAEGSRKVTVDGVAALEAAALGTRGIDGVVLRYGQLYGPGTGRDGPDGASPVHVDAAARAALLAIDRGLGIYNVVEPNAEVAGRRAEEELGWDPSFRWNAGR